MKIIQSSLAAALCAPLTLAANQKVGRPAALQGSPDRQLNSDAGGLLVPLYSWPTIEADNSGGFNCVSDTWAKFALSQAASKTIAIVNPNNGPTYGSDAWKKLSYDTCIAYLQAAGVEVIGYIHTKVGYPNISGYRNYADVKADVDLWKSDYATTGIFIDEVSNRWLAGWDSLDQVKTFNQDLINYILGDVGYTRVVLNPGSPYYEDVMQPYYGNPAVIAVMFEQTQWQYQRDEATECVTGLWTESQGHFDKGPWCPYVPISDNIEPLKDLMTAGTILPEQSAVLIHTAESSEQATLYSITQGCAAGVKWFYILDATAWSSAPTSVVMDAQAAKAAQGICESDSACQWCIHFDTASAQLGPGDEDDITITYKDTPAPTTDGDIKKYSSTLFFTDGETCTSVTNNDGQNAADQGITVGTGSYDVDAGKWKVPLDIDIGTVESLSLASIPDPTNEPNKFQIQFCLKTDLLTVLQGVDVAVDSESTIHTFTVDKEQGFDISGFTATVDPATTGASDVTVNINVEADFCDDQYTTQTLDGTVKPGQAVAFCVSAEAGSGASIASLKNVKFATSEENSDTNIPIVDGTGAGVALSSVACPEGGNTGSGQCRVSTVAYARVFERLVDGTLESINNLAIISGTAVLSLGGRRVLAEVSFRGHNARELQSNETPVNSFDLDVADNFASPPKHSSAPATAVAFVSVMMTGLVGLLI